MTHTTQARSWASLSKPGKDLTTDKDKPDKPEDNIDLLLSVFDSLNNLYEKLNRLHHEIQKRSIKQITDEAVRQRNSKQGEKK